MESSPNDSMDGLCFYLPFTAHKGEFTATIVATPPAGSFPLFSSSLLLFRSRIQRNERKRRRIRERKRRRMRKRMKRCQTGEQIKDQEGSPDIVSSFYLFFPSFSPCLLSSLSTKPHLIFSRLVLQRRRGLRARHGAGVERQWIKTSFAKF